MNGDTIKLLRECDAGVKMGIESIEDVLKNVYSENLRDVLENSRDRHYRLKLKTEQYLMQHGDEGKNPATMASVMSKAKTDFKMMVERTDRTAANLITDGCNMGIKSINSYKNQYRTAENYAIKLADEIIEEETKLLTQVEDYL